MVMSLWPCFLAHPVHSVVLLWERCRSVHSVDVSARTPRRGTRRWRRSWADVGRRRIRGAGGPSRRLAWPGRRGALSGDGRTPSPTPRKPVRSRWFSADLGPIRSRTDLDPIQYRSAEWRLQRTAAATVCLPLTTPPHPRSLDSLSFRH